MLDSNLAMDRAKLEYISQISQGGQMILDIVNHDHVLIDSQLHDRFGISEMISDQSKDSKFLASFLYYFGLLTQSERNEFGQLKLTVPNLVTRGLYIDRIQRMLLPEPAIRDSGLYLASEFYKTCDISPLCQFVETKYFKILSNRDYRWANELTVKTAFLTLLYNETLFIMDSERVAGRGYADLTMIIRQEMRQYKIFDVLIEFKFVPLKEVKINSEQAHNLSIEEFHAITQMQTAMSEAKKQVTKYGDALEKKYKNLRLRKYVVVSLGFERVWGEETL